MASVPMDIPSVPGKHKTRICVWEGAEGDFFFVIPLYFFPNNIVLVLHNFSEEKYITPKLLNPNYWELTYLLWFDEQISAGYNIYFDL